MTEKRFKFVCDDENCYFKDNGKKIDCYEVVDVLNELIDENKKLKNKASYWKITASEEMSENSILMNQICIMMEQGAEPSDAFKKLMKTKNYKVK